MSRSRDTCRPETLRLFAEAIRTICVRPPARYNTFTVAECASDGRPSRGLDADEHAIERLFTPQRSWPPGLLSELSAGLHLGRRPAD